MKLSNRSQYVFVLSLICSIAMLSCRKKDNRYEGNYLGTERYTVIDSGTTTYSTDTTYMQEWEVTYSKKFYTFSSLITAQGANVFSVEKKLLDDHVYTSSESECIDGCGYGYVKFVGDSVYINSSFFTLEGKEKELDFKGKRN